MVLRRSEPRAPVEASRAYEHALMAVRRSWAGGTEGMDAWGGADFGRDPLTIHDLNGEPLFHEFTARLGEREVGRIKAAASRLVGTGVVTIEQGPRRWDPEAAVKMAHESARRRYPNHEVKDWDLVCYCYPKIGVRLELSGGREGRGGSVIFDVSDGLEVTSFDDDGREGLTAYSFLDRLDPCELECRKRQYDLEEKELDAAREKTPRLFDTDLGESELTAVRQEFTPASDYLIWQLYSSKVIKFGPRCSPHDCFMLYAQQTNVYCAVATGQMILDFYRRYFTQDQIAAAMGTGAGGTTNPGQVAGYESLSNGCLDATYDTSADWTEAKAEIDANRPVKSGVPGHARVCTGWKQQNFWLLGTTPKRWLQIHDPWPWNANICDGGAVYWEDWTAITHTNWIYVRHSTTQH